ncbi:hypothetical protein CesoFtcFv8_007255 [Champsocephalus esox]|uniref:Uncharacterized protein n=2 Tax=Champsocephalus TaxID=52236 RepID=A0AAN8DR53_CHAGU|nr:hypothetical protein CesoFtcFv8_007255 [Champsocephalus esox]KAK5927731.1 hypothetical protein CgunFtcFv8_012857 [Champsocephalus gunnari]
MEKINGCPVVVISHRSRALAEIKWGPSQHPAARHLPPKPLPPMAARALRAAERQLRKPDTLEWWPLNTSVTVKGPENLRSLLE